MRKTVGIGLQDFRKVQERNAFYIDKTQFIDEWWKSQDDVTLITRPRRFQGNILPAGKKQDLRVSGRSL